MAAPAGDKMHSAGNADGVAFGAKSDAFAPLRFSTEDFPSGDRVAILRDILRQKFIGIDIEPLPGCPFQVDASVRALPGLGILSAFTLGARAQRTPEHVADGNDCFWLGIVSSGACIISQGNKKIVLEHGEATLMSAAEPSEIICPAMSRSVALSIPASALVPLVTDIDRAIMQPIRRDTEALKLVAAYLGFLKHEIAMATADLRRSAANHVYDLVALAVGATEEAAAVAQDRGLPAARLRAIKADVIDNLGRSDLSVDSTAARHGITPRHVRRLFEAEGSTFSEFVLDQRLVRAYRLLTDRGLAGRAISSIAFDCGFGDLSYFNRTFRRAYGAAPTDIRAPTKR